mgnify:CR=1 FL=1|jgi:hypothetical protein
MSQENHKIINGRLLQMNKLFSQLKQEQKEKIQDRNSFIKNMLAFTMK